MSVERRALVTICCGEFHRRMSELTHPTLAAYARRIGADFLVLDDSRAYSMPHYLKFELARLLDRYDRILYLDTDILVRPDAPDLFGLVPPDRIGLYEEGRVMERAPSMKAYLASQGLDPSRWDGRYFNTGVMVLSSGHRGIFVPPAVEHDHFKEQSYLNRRIAASGFQVQELPYRFNRTYMLDQLTGEQRHDSYILHYAGISELLDPESQLSLIRSDLATWEKSSPEYRFPKAISVVLQGRAAEQACAEPVLRFLKEELVPDAELAVFTPHPEFFSHLPLTIFTRADDPGIPQRDARVLTLSERPLPFIHELKTQPFVSGVELASYQLLGSILPESRRRIRLVPDARALDRAKERLARIPDPGKLVLIYPGEVAGASSSLPVWREAWVSYGTALSQAGLHVAFIGRTFSSHERALPLSVPGCLNWADQLELDELIALVSLSPVLIGNDSLAIQIAGAFENWIGLIATHRHPEACLPQRDGGRFARARNLSRVPMHYDYVTHLAESYGRSRDYSSEERLRACLPSASEVAEFCQLAVRT